jgi:hypothetical protein
LAGAANLARRIGGRPVSWFALGVPYNYSSARKALWIKSVPSFVRVQLKFYV